MTASYTLKAKVWLYDGKSAWHFVTIPANIAKEINDIFALSKRGWGSLRVQATIGETSWQTSIFPDSKTQTYLLPLKKEIRQKENIQNRSSLQVTIEILE